MKKCYTCKEVKPLEDFNKNKSKRDGFATTCRLCMKVIRKNHYEANKESYVEDIRLRTAGRRQLAIVNLLEYLKSNPCVDCGNADPRVLEFDHREPKDKHKEVGAMVIQGYSWETISAEIDKCDVRCANCHRIRTQTQFGYYRAEWIA